MVVTDWPLEVLALFWRDHSVLSAVVSTMLLVGVGVGVGFLAFEARDAQRQAVLDESVTSAGLGGLVDHVVDVEIVLALVGSPHPPSDTTWPGWRDPGRPLGWLRSDRERLGRLDDGGPGLFDPRAGTPEQIADDQVAAWRLELVDQAIRRVIGSIRDWSSVVSRSRSGLRVLVSLGAIRNDLLVIEGLLGSSHGDVVQHPTRVRTDARVLALALEARSRAPVERPEVLLSMRPLCTATKSPGGRTGWLRRKTMDEWIMQLRSARQRLDEAVRP